MNLQVFSGKIIFVLVLSVSLSSVAAQTGREKMDITVQTARDVVDLQKLSLQKPMALGETGGRGITGLVVSKAVQGIQRLIDNRRKKYVTTYDFSIKDEKFYQDISSSGPFDPTGIQFRGFSLVRLYENEGEKKDTAFIARFVLDTSRLLLADLLNNSIFRLRLESLEIKKPRVKVADKDPRLNMDFEIRFYTSYLGVTREAGNFYQDIPVGKFIYSVRNAPLDPTAADYQSFYEKLKNEPCIGQSFLIPRSAGYYLKNRQPQQLERCYGQGIYSIIVSVKESSKPVFVDKIINFGSDDIMSLGNEYLQNKYGPAPAKISN